MQGGTNATGRRELLVLSHRSEPPAVGEPNNVDRTDKLPHSDKCTTHLHFLHKILYADLMWLEIKPALTHTKAWVYQNIFMLIIFTCSFLFSFQTGFLVLTHHLGKSLSERQISRFIAAGFWVGRSFPVFFYFSISLLRIDSR